MRQRQRPRERQKDEDVQRREVGVRDAVRREKPLRERQRVRGGRGEREPHDRVRRQRRQRLRGEEGVVLGGGMHRLEKQERGRGSRGYDAELVVGRARLGAGQRVHGDG